MQLNTPLPLPDARNIIEPLSESDRGSLTVIIGIGAGVGGDQVRGNATVIIKNGDTIIFDNSVSVTGEGPHGSYGYTNEATYEVNY